MVTVGYIYVPNISPQQSTSAYMLFLLDSWYLEWVLAYYRYFMTVSNKTQGRKKRREGERKREERKRERRKKARRKEDRYKHKKKIEQKTLSGSQDAELSSGSGTFLTQVPLPVKNKNR